MAKAKKARAAKYDKKLAIDGTFEYVIRVSVQPGPKEVPKKKKTIEKKKK
jgi:hypothetical protein